MSDCQVGLADFLREQSLRYQQSLPSRRRILEDASAGLSLETDLNAMTQLHRHVHNIVGTGGTFGYPRLSERARCLSLLTQKHLNLDAPLSQADVAELQACLALLVAELKSSEI